MFLRFQLTEIFDNDKPLLKWQKFLEMEVENYINRKKQLYSIFINYIECDCESEEDFDLLIKMIKDQKITNSNSEFKKFLKLLLYVFKNHHRNQYFYTKIEKLLVFLKDDMMNAFTNFEIFES